MRTVLLLATMLFALPAIAGDAKPGATKKLKSGLPPGTGIPSFHVKDITGRFNKRPSICYT